MKGELILKAVLGVIVYAVCALFVTAVASADAARSQYQGGWRTTVYAMPATQGRRASFYRDTDAWRSGKVRECRVHRGTIVLLGSNIVACKYPIDW